MVQLMVSGHRKNINKQSSFGDIVTIHLDDWMAVDSQVIQLMLKASGRDLIEDFQSTIQDIFSWFQIVAAYTSLQ